MYDDEEGVLEDGEFKMDDDDLDVPPPGGIELEDDDDVDPENRYH